MSILTISGSVRKDSTTQAFLDKLESTFVDFDFENFGIDDIPLFHPDAYDSAIPSSVQHLKAKIKNSEAVIIATPEYIHNIPAVLKNALEWTTQTGELEKKKTLAITFTPHEPRGKKAMESLLNSLLALNADVVGSMAIYHTDLDHKKKLVDNVYEILKEGLELLTP